MLDFGLWNFSRSVDDWRSDFDGVLLIGDFLAPADAQEAALELSRCNLWRRRHYVCDRAAESVEEVGEAEYKAASRRASADNCYQYSSVDILSAEQLAALSVTGSIRKLLNSPAFANRLSELLGTAVETASDVNAACYRRADFLRAHCDLYDRWVASLIVYLPVSAWTLEDGGRLGYRSAVRTTRTPPVRNTAAIIPIGENASHWVEPVTSESFARQSLTLHFMEAANS